MAKFYVQVMGGFPEPLPMDRCLKCKKKTDTIWRLCLSCSKTMVEELGYDSGYLDKYARDDRELSQNTS